jgi:hypothetical protein
LAFTAALLSKESALIFPALLALSIAFVPRGSPGSARPMSRWTGFFFCLAVAAGYAALRSAVLNFGAETGTRHVAFGVRLTESLQALALYLKLVFVPTGLHMERTLRGVSWPAAVAGGVLIATMLTLVWMTFRTNRRRASFGFAWFLLTWLPISGLFPLNAPMAEHWMYLPLPGLLLGLAEVVDEFAGRTDAWRLRPRRVIGAIVGIWFIAMILLTVARNRDWHDNESLYLATLRKNSESTRVQFNLGVTYQDILDNPAGARRHFENVVAVYERRKASDATLAQQYWTEELEAHLSLGELYRKAGRYTEAIPHYGVLLAITANAENSASIGRAAYGIGRCYLALGEYEAARAGFRRATELVPALGMQAERDMAREAPLAAMSIR